MVNQKNIDKKMDHIRKILDNPHQNINLYNKYESTLRARLIGQPSYQPPISHEKSMDNHELRPLVIIHHEQIKKPEMQPDIKKIESAQPIQQEANNEELLKDNEDIFDIEPESQTEIPIFIEVKQKDRFDTVQPDQLKTNVEDESEDMQNLPKWEPVIENEKTQEIMKEEQEIVTTFTEIKSKQNEKHDEIQKEVIEKEENITKKETPLIWETVEKGKDKETVEPKKKIFQKRKTDKKDKKPHHKTSYFSSHKSDMEEDLENEPKETILKEEPKKSIKKGTDKQTTFTFKDYTLYQKEIDLGNNKKRTIHFFSKETPEDSIATTLPDNYEVKINKKTGVPYLRKKQ